MTAQPPKGPPRFVPTLTEVVRLDVPSAPQGAPPAVGLQSGVVPGTAKDARAAHATAGQPMPVPAPPDRQAAVSAPTAATLQPPPVPAPQAAPENLLRAGIEEYIIHRVMQRVDVVLDQRLREAIATVVQEQTRSMVPRLREEVESVVRHAVYEAVAEELSADGPSPR